MSHIQRGRGSGVIYFVLVFAVGWVLGPIRELWAVPHFGRMAATLSEAVTAPGVVSLLMFLLFAAMPTLVTRAGSVSRPNDTAEAEDL